MNRIESCECWKKPLLLWSKGPVASPFSWCRAPHCRNGFVAVVEVKCTDCKTWCFWSDFSIFSNSEFCSEWYLHRYDGLCSSRLLASKPWRHCFRCLPMASHGQALFHGTGTETQNKPLASFGDIHIVHTHGILYHYVSLCITVLSTALHYYYVFYLKGS